jgi:hypothetical protein
MASLGAKLRHWEETLEGGFCLLRIAQLAGAAYSGKDFSNARSNPTRKLGPLDQ